MTLKSPTLPIPTATLSHSSFLILLHLTASHCVSLHLTVYHYLSLYLTVSHSISASLHLTASHCVSECLTVSYSLSVSHCVSLHLTTSQSVSLHLTTSLWISLPHCSSEVAPSLLLHWADLMGSVIVKVILMSFSHSHMTTGALFYFSAPFSGSQSESPVSHQLPGLLA